MLHPFKKLFNITGFYTFFERRFEAGYSFEGEHHHFWEVIYCLGGSAGISADDTVYYLQPGDVVIHRPYVHHTTWAEKETTQLMIFSFDINGDMPPEICGAFSCDAELREKFDSLYCRIKESGCDGKCTGFLHYLDRHPAQYQEIANLCENHLLSLRSNGMTLGKNLSKDAIAYEHIIRVMRENLSKNLSVEELASICGISSTSIKTLFRRFNSMSIHSYYLHLKMREAVRLLESGKTVTETAELLGFSSQSYFSTVFKREMKERPGFYRRNSV